MIHDTQHGDQYTAWSLGNDEELTDWKALSQPAAVPHILAAGSPSTVNSTGSNQLNAQRVKVVCQLWP